MKTISHEKIRKAGEWNQADIFMRKLGELFDDVPTEEICLKIAGYMEWWDLANAMLSHEGMEAWVAGENIIRQEYRENSDRLWKNAEESGAYEDHKRWVDSPREIANKQRAELFAKAYQL